MKHYSDRGAEMNYTQRFRFGNLAQTYMKYRDVFRKRIQMREEGALSQALRRGGSRHRSSERRSGKEQSSSVVLTCANPTSEREKVTASTRLLATLSCAPANPPASCRAKPLSGS